MSALTIETGQAVEVTPVHPHIGAEVRGVDLRRPLDDASFDRIRDAFDRHSVLVFRDQRLTDEQQVAFSERFGALEPTSFKVASQHPYVYALSNVDDAGRVLQPDSAKRNFLLVNARWHTDSSFRPVPAMASLLSGREVPSREGGDTEFASMRVGYETLAPPRRAELESLVAVHSYAYSLSLFGDTGVPEDELRTVPPVEHPVVRTHPGTGTRNLYVSGHIERIVGMPVEEGRALAAELIAWCARPDYVYRHRWRQHDLVMWDNRAALHRATAIPTGERRIMHRTTVAGEGPVRASAVGVRPAGPGAREAQPPRRDSR